MKMFLLIFIFVSLSCVNKSIQERFVDVTIQGRHYKPDWKDLDSRPLPQWYDAAKIGVFMHWGVYSVPSLNGEWFWRFWVDGNKEIAEYMRKHYPPNFTYQDFGREFTAEFFDPDDWAHLFSQGGFKYVVLTTKHHDGFTLFPSRRSFGWNSVDVGPKRDLVGDLAKALSKKNVKFGAYHSLFEWFNPIFLEDWNKNTDYYPELKTWPDLKQIVNDYKPSLIWADGVHFKNYTYWNSTYFLSWLYNDSPVKDEVVVNDRWGYKTDGKHGDFYNNGDENFQSNALMDFGPTKEGTIPIIMQERLMTLGKWLKVNGEAIYDTSPWFHQKDESNDHAWYTCSKSPFNSSHPTSVPTNKDTIHAVYVTILKWPEKERLILRSIVPYMKEWKIVQLLGNKNILKYEFIQNEIEIYLPQRNIVKSDYAWSLKFTQS